MKRQVWNRSAKLLGAVAIAAVAASLVFGQVREAEVERRDQADVARMTQKMKTVCIGRFPIDLPDETRFELRGPRIHGLDISSFDESEADFQVRLAQREARLRATPDRLGGYRDLESAREVTTDNGVLVPHVVFKMYAGKGENGPVHSSLSQDAAMALWDKISSSMRFHHAGPRKDVIPAPPAGASTKASRTPEV